MDALEQDKFKDSSLIMQLLRDNLTVGFFCCNYCGESLAKTAICRKNWIMPFSFLSFLACTCTSGGNYEVQV